jgi:hypothetical protein
MRKIASNYRRIYEKVYGKIPKDSDGRSYEIHHIDGNHHNNDISNLKAVTIHEHYQIHLIQEDWDACLAMLRRMSVSPTEIGEMSRKAQKKRVAAGTHNLLGKNNPVHKKIADGTHHLFGNKNPRVGGKDHYLFDSTEYLWENIKTGERITMLRSDFIKKFNATSGNVAAVINKKPHNKSVMGWRLVETE